MWSDESRPITTRTRMTSGKPGRRSMPLSSTRLRGGVRVTSRSATTATSKSIPPKSRTGRSISSSWSITSSCAASAFRRSSLHATSCSTGSRTSTKRFRPPSRSTNTRANTVCVYPIKVNQQRQVVEEVFNFGKPFNFGLEAGSKPELIAVVAIADNDTPIICNGFKDAEFIELAMLAQKIGRNIIPVVEKYTELDLILEHAERVGVRPDDRHARQARRARRRAVAVVGRLPLEVRADGRRDPARASKS